MKLLELILFGLFLLFLPMILIMLLIDGGLREWVSPSSRERQRVGRKWVDHDCDGNRFMRYEE